MANRVTRRRFLGTAAGVAAAGAAPARAARPASGEKLALLGGKPVRTQPFPSWPLVRDNDEKAWMDVLRTGKWYRLSGSYVKQFEQAWAKALGARYCVATANGTSALLTSLNALEVGPGDEVIVPPYTFVATINVVLMQHALPVFVDTDPDTSQIDARKIEAAITPHTRAILPVHLGGSPADMDTVLAVAKKHKLPVVEDACQAHTGEWRGRRVSTLGDLGCFSFQASKNLNSGEGGAIMTNSQDLYERCWMFHNNGRLLARSAFEYARNGCNLRLTEFQAALLLSQMTRLEEQSRLREQNAAYLGRQLKEVPGLAPARLHDGCTRHGYHIYMMRYDKSRFANLPRAKFLQAMRAEGIPCSGGYSPLNKDPFLKKTLESRAFKAVYSPDRIARWHERNHCPANDKLCEEAVWTGQTTLLGTREDMDHIVEAARKIQTQAAALLTA
jgi:dTDP-4-amino-4,6-dideoxygalactose transaminase